MNQQPPLGKRNQNTMARQETDKEDLITEATALVDRAEYTSAVPTDDCNTWSLVTIGFRKDGCFSIYFDQDPFYQFDASGHLRRACIGPYLFRSQGTTLARLNRERSDQQTTLQRMDLDDKQLSEFQSQMLKHLQSFQHAIRTGTMKRGRYVTTCEDIDSQTLDFIESILKKTSTFLSTTINMR